jgi:hypothetical protein
MDRNDPPKAFGVVIAARGVTVGVTSAPPSALVGSFSARRVAIVAENIAVLSLRAVS